jgi:hypothetical protein
VALAACRLGARNEGALMITENGAVRGLCRISGG